MRVKVYLQVALIVIISFFSSSFSFSQNDEFTEFNEESSIQNIQQDSLLSDEFGESFDELDQSTGEFFEDEISSEEIPISYNRLNWAIAILLFTILAGILVRIKSTRKLRVLFLLASMVFLGFYRGGPGIISSLQNTYLLFIGFNTNWQAIILFLGLLPITYFFGKVFCGWACYLGALQEFLYIGRIKLFQTEKAQKIMRITRYIVFGLLLIQLTITNTILWNKIGPFKVAFNLYSTNLTGYILLAILLISSLFIYRPFCKAICPAGLIFGWITKIPGAAVLGINSSCAGCKTCSTSCKINAITRDKKQSKLDNQECIMCGECMDDCNIKSISTKRKGEKHHGKIILKGIKISNNI